MPWKFPYKSLPPDPHAPDPPDNTPTILWLLSNSGEPDEPPSVPPSSQ